MSKDKAPMIVTLDADELAAIVRREVDDALERRAPQQLPDPIMSAEEAAAFLKMPVNILRKRARQGEIESFKIGALVRFRMPQLKAFLAAQPSARKKTG